MPKIRKCVIPVAGLGSRFLPITKSIPKTMLSVVDKPIIHYLIEEAYASGIEEVLLISNKDKHLIESYFHPNKYLESRLIGTSKMESLNAINEFMKKVKVECIVEKEPLGSGHAIKLAREFIDNEPFAVMFGDNLIDGEYPALKQLIDIYEKYDANVIGVQSVPEEEIHLYGIIDYENKITGKIKTIVEKPNKNDAPSNMAAIGRYIIKPEVFKIVDELKPGLNNEYQFTDAISNLLKIQSFYACEIKGESFDTGNQLGYIKANIAYGLKREDIKKEIKEYIKSIL